MTGNLSLIDKTALDAVCAGKDITFRTGCEQIIGDYLAAVQRHHNGRTAVPGKPLELQTRDELMAYIKEQDETVRMGLREIIRAAKVEGCGLSYLAKVAEDTLNDLGGVPLGLPDGEPTAAVTPPASSDQREITVVDELDILASMLEAYKEAAGLIPPYGSMKAVLEAIRPSVRITESVSLAVCAAASYRACANHYNGTHDPLHNPGAVHTDIAKAILAVAGVPYVD